MKKLFTTLTIITILQLSNAFAHNSETFEKMPFLKPYSELLEKYVHPETLEGIPSTGVNYLGWQSDPKHKTAMKLLEKTNLSDIKSKEEKISFWINAYNLLTIDLIVTKGEQESIHNLGGLVGDPWNEFSWVIDGLEITLSQINHQTLRNINEPRVNFALTCAAISCPNLKNQPYWPQLIYTQLERQTREFLRNKEKGVKLIKSPKTDSNLRQTDKFKVSQIFQWFNNDFEHGNIERFVQRYVFLYGATHDGYLPYNWNLNALTGKKPKPVQPNE